MSAAIYRRARGVTLVELMISMLLGLVVIGGAMGVILANRHSYRTNEGLSQIQESARTAFELLARDIRQAGVTGCTNNGRVANVVISTGGTPWWQSWFGLRGFDGGQSDGAVGLGTAAPGNRVEGTDSIHVQGIEGLGQSIISHDPSSATMRIDQATGAIAADDIMMACDFDHAAIFKVTEYHRANVTVMHDAGASESLRNCSKGLGYPTVCETVGNTYAFGPNAQLAHVMAADWYVGDNRRPLEGGRSLYRRRMNASSEEIVAGVTDMQARYREAGRSDFREATSVEAWEDVNAVMITLTLQSEDQRITTDARRNSGRLQRQFTSIVTLRNRVP